MGKYSVPERIRSMKPRGTMVKAIGGRYYVYEYRSVARGGRRKTEMGRCIGSITDEDGFVPNGARAREGEVTTLEFGQYAVALANSAGVLAMLREHFDPRDAAQVYALAVVNCVNGMQPAKDAGRHFAMSALSLRFPSLKMGPDALATLLDALGRRQGPVHVVRGGAVRVGGAGGRRGRARDAVVVSPERPGGARLQAGQARVRPGQPAHGLRRRDGPADAVAHVRGGGAGQGQRARPAHAGRADGPKMFVADAGFYSKGNVEALASNGCSYIIPLHKRLLACREAVADPEVDGRFVYRRGGRASAVEYRDARRRGARVVLFRDLNKQAMEQAGYLAKLGQGAEGYTAEGFEEAKDLMGVIVLQTSREDMSAQEVYEAYKRKMVGGGPSSAG